MHLQFGYVHVYRSKTLGNTYYRGLIRKEDVYTQSLFWPMYIAECIHRASRAQYLLPSFMYSSTFLVLQYDPAKVYFSHQVPMAQLTKCQAHNSKVQGSTPG